ncbi:odorant receptor 13a isoform X1 [Diachasma alloeum]|uniref:odorant receptor 13a isoform X1 n=1 Tax=Diachasma alloeum TaxID=454923 RepID=UPI0010FB6863|nr:odorant receptor 13a isoform X1 [Diachasma alloeum]
MNVLLLYTIGGLVTSFVTTAIDIYHCFGDFDKFTYCSMNVFTVGFGFYKLIAFLLKRKEFLNLISHIMEHFWNVDYDDYGSTVMKDCMLRCTRIVTFAIFMCHLTISMHYVKALIENRGKNESDRDFPFRFYSDLPLSLSPWFEILFVAQIFASYPCCYTYFCFENFLCQINITVVGQFLILNKEMREICDTKDTSSLSIESGIRPRLVRCVQKHQHLIACVETTKELYRSVMLGVVILLSFLICLEMFELMSANSNTFYTFHYCLYAGGSIVQLYFYTLSCDKLTEASESLSDAAYDVRWYLTESGASKNQLVKDLMMIIMRSQRACSLTVGGFTPVTLQTFTSICNTAFSFLTLIRQSV